MIQFGRIRTAINSNWIPRTLFAQKMNLSSLTFSPIEARQELPTHIREMIVPNLSNFSKFCMINVDSALSSAIWYLKRTFQPSLVRMKRKHGFLARLNDRNGRKILNRRREKGRRLLSN